LTEPASAGSSQPKKAQPNGLDHLLYLLHSVPDGRGTVPNAAAAVQHEYTTQSYPLAHGQVALVTVLDYSHTNCFLDPFFLLLIGQ
jgi:hypothetical protein